jgi:7-cyano-7-deazaguanine synthase in queuosine biosynthesis
MLPREVFCGGLKPGFGDPEALEIDIAASDPSNRVNLQIDRLARRLADDVPAVLVDLLEIAAYVYCADQFTSRGSILMSRMGEKWRRRFHFHIPVRRPEVWSQLSVRAALIETLNFLSEDECEFEFVGSRKSIPLQAHLPFNDPAAQVIRPDEVILFSGGLDSLAGAAESVIGGGQRVALVSHQASKMIASRQNALVKQLTARAVSNTPFHVPIVVNKGQEEAAEFTQRTRSFLFAALGLIVARMFGRNKLSFYENGIVSMNLPIAEHVLGTRATRTTHPRVLDECSRLFSLLLDEDFRIQNPYLCKTKTDVIGVLAQRSCQTLISDTFSCAKVREATRSGQHCGVCSQCVDRRFGMLAAGLQIHDPVENYAVDLFRGKIEAGNALTMIESYVLRAQNLLSMSLQAFVATYGQIFRIIPHLPGSADESAQAIWDLHRRHGKEVVSVIDTQLGPDRSVDLPPNSLLAIIASPIATQPSYVDPVEDEPSAASQAAVDPHEYKWTPILFGVDAKNRKIVFAQDVELSGSSYSLLFELAKQFETDRTAGLAAAQHEFVRADKLADKLAIDPQTLRRRVSRARRDIERAFSHHLARQLMSDAVIENKRWEGYRLNPSLIPVQPSDLRARSGRMSQLEPVHVTCRTAGR